MLKKYLTAYGYGLQNFTCDLLLNASSEPKYLLGVSEDGFVILERNTYEFYECGGGNPYGEYMEDPKYYGDPVCYFVKTEAPTAFGSYYNIMAGTYSSVVPTLDIRESSDSPNMAPPSGTASAASSEPIVYKTHRIDNAYEYVQRYAFGYNDDNTCSAVATGIALNYIAQQNNMAIIEKDKVPERLDNGLAAGNTIKGLYPKANRLHRYIVETSGMKAASFADGITKSVKIYASDMIPNAYSFDMEWTISPKENTIKGYLDRNIPVLITTTLFAGEYNWHTMCVYGYQETSDGVYLLIHTGWWQINIRSSGNQYYQDERWIKESCATYGYYFSFQNPLSNFKDLPYFTDWSIPGILYVVKHNLMNGTSATTFAPNRAMSRAMLVATLYRMAGSPSVTYANQFTDVPSSAWYASSVAWAVNNGIVQGVGNGKFEPNSDINREQLATFLYRYANYKKYNTSQRADLTSYPDYASVSSYARTPMSWAVGKGILTGTVKNNVTVLAPKDAAIRSHVAAVLMRFDKAYRFFPFLSAADVSDQTENFIAASEQSYQEVLP